MLLPIAVSTEITSPWWQAHFCSSVRWNPGLFVRWQPFPDWEWRMKKDMSEMPSSSLILGVPPSTAERYCDAWVHIIVHMIKHTIYTHIDYYSHQSTRKYTCFTRRLSLNFCGDSQNILETDFRCGRTSSRSVWNVGYPPPRWWSTGGAFSKLNKGYYGMFLSNVWGGLLCSESQDYVLDIRC